MPRNLEARNFLSLLQRSPSPPPPPPLPAPQRAVCALSLLAVSIASSLLHFAPPPFATPFLPSSFCHTPSCHVIPLIPFRRPYHRDPWTSTCPPPFSLSSVPAFHRLPPSLSKRTHSRINRYGRVTRVYIGGAPRGPSLITYPAVAARVNDGKGCLRAKDFFSIIPGQISIK